MTNNGAKILGVFINACEWNNTLDCIAKWAAHRESRYVCICNAHSVVTAALDIQFQRIVDDADLATPDGFPVAWMLRKLGFYNQQRINGPDLMWKYCEAAAHRSESIYLYGGSPETLEALTRRLNNAFPSLKIAGTYSPPFRRLTESEEAAVVTRINSSGAGSVWVSLGCPKQEKWMADHRGRINAVMIGVGAAFDYHAGKLRRAPLWMQNFGLEWLYRLISEPSRLWKRYLITNSIFIVRAIWQLMSMRFKSK